MRMFATRDLPRAISLLLLSTTLAHAAEPTPSPRPGKVSLNTRALRDDAGEFLGLGVTYFPALRRTKFDRARFRSDLEFLSRRHFNYIRTLSMVGWYPAWKGKEIAPVTFKNKEGQTIRAWDDYWVQLAAMIDIAYDDFGLRTQLTLFADAQLMPDRADRIRHLDKVLETIKTREHKIILLEVANEAWQNGFPGEAGIDDLRAFGKHLADRTDVLIALSATSDTTDEQLRRTYVGSAADIATVHFTRDLRTPAGDWLPVFDVFRVNGIDRLPPASHNEPIGPGSSVAEQRDPLKLVVAAAYAWMSGLPMYVYHCSPGIFGEGRLEEMPGVSDFAFIKQALPTDIASWQRTQGEDDFAPFITFTDGEANKPRTAVPNAKSGALRHLSCVRGRDFYTLPVGIRKAGVELEAKRPMSIEIFHPITGELRRAKLIAGERTRLEQGPGAYLIRGRFAD